MPVLFKVCDDRRCTVAEVMDKYPLLRIDGSRTGEDPATVLVVLRDRANADEIVATWEGLEAEIREEMRLKPGDYDQIDGFAAETDVVEVVEDLQTPSPESNSSPEPIPGA